MCRPRFGGHPDLHVLTRDDAPELFALIDRVAALAGAPLWAALDPQERVALLGHFVNGDLRRAPLESMALSTLGHLAYLTQPGESGVAAAQPA